MAVKTLMEHAGDLGVAVYTADLDDGILGEFYADEFEIYLAFDLTYAERRSVLAHELGHAYYTHRGESDVFERQADIYAAHLLLDPEAYSSLSAVNADRHYIAEELQVTPHLVETFERYFLTRAGGITLVRPRLGMEIAHAMFDSVDFDQSDDTGVLFCEALRRRLQVDRVRRDVDASTFGVGLSRF